MTLPFDRPSGPSRAVPDPEALALIRSGVHHIALHELRDADDAADIAQETLARLLDALAKRTDRIADAGAFARGIARHLIADARRDAVRRQSLDIVAQAPQLTIQPDPLHDIALKEDCDRVRRALMTLSPDDRAVLRAMYVDGLSPSDLAALLSQPPERVRKRKSRALSRLRDAFMGHALPSAPTATVDDQ